MSVDPLSSRPVYLQVADVLRDRITSGALQADRPVPSITQLVQEFGIARGTAAKVLALLEEEGLVVKVPGKGTYVRDPKSDA